jgi:Fic family protein
LTEITAMEPLLPDVSAELSDAVVSLVQEAGAFAGRIHPVMRQSVGDLVRSMNCYYSNLIEGHDTHPVDIDRALAGNYSSEPRKRDLQLEARAHIEVQAVIDRGGLPFPVASVEAIVWIHREFCSRLPEELLKVANPDTGEERRVEPGELRAAHVRVGRHVAPEPQSLPGLLSRFAEFYSGHGLSKIQKIIAAGAAHHRLLWIHPFLDGNGRVARLMSHAMLRELGVGSELWSVSRGLARSVERYKALLQAADEPRRGDLDGRGNLTEGGLARFCAYFLEQCLDQVRFMQSLTDPKELMGRIEIWCAEEVRAKRLAKGSWQLLREAVLAGEFERSAAADLTGYKGRQARTVLSALVGQGLLVSASPKGKLRLGFPVHIVERWLPRLYPPQ